MSALLRYQLKFNDKIVGSKVIYERGESKVQCIPLDTEQLLNNYTKEVNFVVQHFNFDNKKFEYVHSSNQKRIIKPEVNFYQDTALLIGNNKDYLSTCNYVTI